MKIANRLLAIKLSYKALKVLIVVHLFWIAATAIYFFCR